MIVTVSWGDAVLGRLSDRATSRGVRHGVRCLRRYFLYIHFSVEPSIWSTGGKWYADINMFLIASMSTSATSGLSPV